MRKISVLKFNVEEVYQHEHTDYIRFHQSDSRIQPHPENPNVFLECRERVMPIRRFFNQRGHERCETLVMLDPEFEKWYPMVDELLEEGVSLLIKENVDARLEAFRLKTVLGMANLNIDCVQKAKWWVRLKWVFTGVDIDKWRVDK